MEPTIRNGEGVLVSSIPYLFSKPKVGDIVLIRHSGDQAKPETPESSWRFRHCQNDEGSKFLIKRITKIDPSADGEKYFVRGDNEKDSVDSRRFGRIERKEIVGKVVYAVRFQ